jgi:hypothetical protein
MLINVWLIMFGAVVVLWVMEGHWPRWVCERTQAYLNLLQLVLVVLVIAIFLAVNRD